MSNLTKSQLGKRTATPDKYNPDLLFRIRRSDNRVKYGISDASLPFEGVDVWNCYEVSFLTDGGLPVSRMMKIIFNARNEYLIESKSLKIYLNSLNFSRLGQNAADATLHAEKLILSDLRRTLDCDGVSLKLFDCHASPQKVFVQPDYKNLTDYFEDKYLNINIFNIYKEDGNLLYGVLKKDDIKEYAFWTDILRSNCPVTHQPDWGDLYIRIETEYILDFQSVAAYIISFRRENHFHEEVVEMIYQRLSNAFAPKKLMVAAMYTRRGGIDINPVRASHADWIEPAFADPTCLAARSWRQ